MGVVGTVDGIDAAGHPGGHSRAGAAVEGRVPDETPLTWRLTAGRVPAVLVLGGMVALPLVEMATRASMPGLVPASAVIVQHLTLVLAFAGAALAARDRRLLALSTATFLPARVRSQVQTVAAFFTALVAGLLVWGATVLVVSEREVGATIGAHVPVWVVQAVLPAGLTAIALQTAWHASDGWAGRGLASLGLAVAGVLAFYEEALAGMPAWPWVAAVVAAAVCGAPLFAVLGGLAAVLFMTAGEGPVQILIETFALTTSPTLPAIPLFTLAGFLLAEGRASARLLAMFRAWFGWMPGGTAVVCAVLCSFFTVFTGGSGVTILALGGLLYPALRSEGYPDRFSIGLLTASGSLGLLLPPALPLILYAVVAEQPVEDLFVAGALPGLLMTAAIAALGIREGARIGTPRLAFEGRRALQSLVDARWELLLPILIVTSMLMGLATAVESAALAVGVVIAVQWLWRRELTATAVLRATTESATVVGGVLLILGMAVGFSAYLVGAQVPLVLVEWTQARLESPLAFLLALNLFLLVVGCLLDVFSATVVVVPLILPLGAAYGVHPVHLGMIFIANLELGYMTPPVGLNLFLSAYRFNKPMLEVAVATLPMLVVLGLGVLAITYFPWLTLGPLHLLGRP